MPANTPTFDLIVDAAMAHKVGHEKAGQPICGDCAAAMALDKLPAEVLRIALAEIVADFVEYSVPEED